MNANIRECGNPPGCRARRTSLAFTLPLGDDVIRKFDNLEISSRHDAATMPQLRIHFRPSDAFLPSMWGAAVCGE
jgi:hypothetical protein